MVVGVYHPQHSQAVSPLRVMARGSRSSSAGTRGIAPRFGIVHDFGGPLVLRGGVGLFYDTGQQAIGSIVGNSYPFTASRTLRNVTLPLAVSDLTPPAPDAVTGYQTFTITVIDPDLALPRTLQWNAGADWTIARVGTVSAAWVGARGRKLLRKTYSEDAVAPIPFLAVVASNGNSDYDVLQMQFRAQPRSTSAILVSYTLSKATDDGSTEAVLLPPDDRIPAGFMRGPSDFDVRYAVSASVTAQAPQNAHVLFRGWTLDALVRARSGLPFTVVTGTDPARLGLFNVARPDVVSATSFYVDDPAAPAGRRLDRAAFVVPTTGLGTLRRNAVRGFAAAQVDADRAVLSQTRKLQVDTTTELAFDVSSDDVFLAEVTSAALDRLEGESPFSAERWRTGRPSNRPTWLEWSVISRSR